MITKGLDLEELTQYQADFINRLLTEQGVSQKEFAASIGTTPVTVSRWKNGKNMISDFFAYKIKDVYPEYTFAEITGYRAMMREQANEAARAYAKEYACFESLLKLCDVDEILRAEPLPIRIGNTVINGDSDFARLMRGEETITLTGNQYEAFKNELFDYARMRLNSMFERGCW